MRNDYRTWRRLEPQTHREEDLVGLRAAVHDPLWTLGRQWQVGDLEGEDGGSPVRIDAWVERDRVSKVDLGGGPRAYDPGDAPLETIVERETVVTGGRPGMGVAVEAGLHFLRLLDRFDHPSATDSPAAADFDSSYHLQETDYRDGADVPESEAARRFGMVVDGRALDGYEVYDALVTTVSGLLSAGDWDDGGIGWSGSLPTPGSTVDSGYKRAAKAFVDWYADLYDEPETGEDAWDETRLEYDFAIATGDRDTETVLTAEEYAGGHLDWAAFDVDPTTTMHDGSPTPQTTETGVTEADLRKKSVRYVPDPSSATTGNDEMAVQRPDVSVLPSSVSYPGMPAPRWWEFENGNVNLFGANVGPGELGKEILIDFAVSYGNDWFSFPLETPVGSMTRVTSLAVVDTFGVLDVATPTQEVVSPDGSQTDDGTQWNLFTETLPTHHDEPGLFLPPTLGDSFEGDPVERVAFVRDELANLAWAIEDRVEGPYGTSIDLGEFTGGTLDIADVQSATDPADEYVEIGNSGDEPLDIDGWTLIVHRETDAGGVVERYAFASSTEPPSIEPDGSIRVVPDTGPDDANTRYWERDADRRSESLLTDATKVVVRNAAGEDGWPVAYRDLRPEARRGTLDAYRLASDVLDHWYPLRPLQSGLTGGFEMKDTTFALSRLVDADLDEIPSPKGRILEPYVPANATGDPLTIHDEELTRAGVEVTRAYQLARWTNGESYLWSGRTTSTGRGQGSSGLQYDYLDTPEVE